MLLLSLKPRTCCGVTIRRAGNVLKRNENIRWIMISITIKKVKDTYKEVNCIGHADFAEHGDDIVCAAASILVINTLNCIEKFTKDTVKVSSEQKTGTINAVFDNEPSPEAALLLDSMVFGLKGIQQQYGKKYISVNEN